jgi:hypothetical protein
VTLARWSQIPPAPLALDLFYRERRYAEHAANTALVLVLLSV